MLAMVTGMVLFYARPFPEGQVFLRVIAMRAPQAFLSFRYLYNVCLFTTPYIAYLGVLSALYIGTLKFRPRDCRGPPSAVSGSQQAGRPVCRPGRSAQPSSPGPSETPQWLDNSRTRFVHGDRDFGSRGKRKNLMLHVSLCGANPRL